MADVSVAPFGSWHSPISARMVAEAGVALGQIQVDGDAVYWLEGRPLEGGRVTIVREGGSGDHQDLLPHPFNARSRVHEYGGGAYTVQDGTVVFSNFSDNRLYRLTGGDPVALTPEGEMRYADLHVDTRRQRIICIREDHSVAGEPINTIVAVPLQGGAMGDMLVEGNNFYAFPTLSPDGNRLAWITWCHPNMPWDGTELWVSEIDARGSIEHARTVAGGPSESILQPAWGPDGALYFLSDRTGWWNLYRLGADGAIEAIAAEEADIGGPLWALASSWFDFLPDGSVSCTTQHHGLGTLSRIEPATGKVTPIPLPYTSFDDCRVAAGRIVLHAASPTEGWAVVRVDPATGGVEVLRRSSDEQIDPAFISVPEEIEFPTSNDATAHGWFYRPRNPVFAGPPGALPPLIVMSHGGPTGSSGPELDLEIQFWTSRGFAVLDVNYRGSTSFGRRYREALNGAWGIVDVDDCANGALELARRGRVDGKQLIIRGSSAGGYTTLCALTFGDVFRAGASYYGIGDLVPFVRETHKFESRYLDRLIGPYPDRADLYHDRSPLNFTDRISAPMILFQGLDDKVVTPKQAELMLAALQSRGLPHAYVPFEGEGHGFRQAENVRRATEAELYFYSRVFGFRPAESIEPVPIKNLADAR